MLETLRTVAENYILPTKEEMRGAANAVNLKSFSRDLVADLCNLAAGGKCRLPSEYRDGVEKRVEETLSAPDKSGWWTVSKEYADEGRSSTTKSRIQAVQSKAAKEMRYHQNVCDFLQSVDLSKFPGSSPLEQAVSLLKLLSKSSGGSGGGESGEPLPIFQDNDNPESEAKALNDLMDEVDSLSEEEQNMLDPDGENASDDGSESGQKSLNRLKVAEDIHPASDKSVMLKISRTLDSFTKLQVRKRVKLEVDPEGDENQSRPMKDLSELGKIEKPAWALKVSAPAHFMYKAVTGGHNIRERVTRNEKKQAIFILVDGSGSMSGKKHFKATGVVMNRLKSVLLGDSEVYLSVFDTEMADVDSAKTPEEARKLIKKFAEKNFSGGGTDIAAAVRGAHKYIETMVKEGAALYRPEIVVLTDEDSSISGLKKSEIKGTIVHGFAMEVANPSLVHFAKNTGGVGLDKF